MNTKKSSVPKDQMDQNTYQYNKTVDPLQNKFPRWKGGKHSIKKEQRPEVKETLLPWMEDFVKTRLKWKKLPKMYQNDTRTTLIQHFVGKHYPSMVWKGGKQVKKNIWYKPNATGKKIIDAIKAEMPCFEENEILDTLIQVMYKHRIDHYSIALKPFVNTRPDQKAVSIWDRISENVQV